MQLPWTKKKPTMQVITAQDMQADSYLGSVLNTVKHLARRMSGGAFGVSPDGKRDYNELFGYGVELSYSDYKGMYERGGYAVTVVELFPKACWRDDVTIEVNESQVLDDEIKLLKRAGMFSALEKADIANRIGSFSVLFIGVPDGLSPDLPVGSASSSNFKGLYFSIYEEDGIEVVLWDQDPASPRYGLPELYTLQVIPESNNKLQVNLTAMTVHHSRVVHLAEGSISSPLVGKSCLKAPWNALTDKNKVRGSSAEAYYRNARQKLALETDAGVPMSTDPAVRAALKENVEGFQNGLEDTLRLSGMKANMLQPAMSSPRDSFDISTEEVAGATRIPVRFLTTKTGGNVTGSEDKAALNAVVKDRQEQECSTWLMAALEIIDESGMISLPDNIDIVWPVQISLSDKEASESSKNKAEAFKAVADGLSTIGGDEVAAESVFKAVGLDGIDIDEIILSDDDKLDKDAAI